VIGWTAAASTLPVACCWCSRFARRPATRSWCAARRPGRRATALLPLWFLHPFSLVIVIHCRGRDQGRVLAGLALLGSACPSRGPDTTAINTVVISAGAFYLLFVSELVPRDVPAFLTLVAVLMGTWAASRSSTMQRGRFRVAGARAEPDDRATTRRPRP